MKGIRRSIIYILSTVMISATVLVGTFFALSSSGVLDGFNKTLAIQTADATKIYDGTELVSQEFNITSGKLKKGHTVTITSGTSLVMPGETENVLDIKISDASGADVTSEYDIEYTYGILKVSAIPVDIETETNTSTVYDGQPHTFAKTRINGKTYDRRGLLRGVDLGGGNKLTLKELPEFTDVGTYKNEVSFAVTDVTGKDVTKIFDLTGKPGTITIQKRVLELTSQDASKEYDGTPLEHPFWNDASGQLIGGHTITAKPAPESSITEVGSTDNVLIYTILDGENNDVTSNYAINSTNGTLEIKEKNEKAQSPDDVGDVGPDAVDGNTVAFKLKTDITGTIYLKIASYGDYTGTEDWNKAIAFAGNATANPQAFVANMLKDGKTPNNAEIIESSFYMLPYFTTDDAAYTAQDDVSLDGTKEGCIYLRKTYSVQFINYSQQTLSELFVKAPVDNSEYTAFVNANYLTVEENSASIEKIDDIIVKNGWNNLDAKELITAVQQYVSSYRQYDKKANFSESTDLVADFLDKTNKEGGALCRHYAATATLMYRRLGIPARYTVGFMAEIEQTETPTEIKAERGHAWVEIYLNGYGWIPVEVTGTDDTVPPPVDEESIKIEIKTGGGTFGYTGDAHSVGGYKQTGIPDGYTLDFTYPEFTDVGEYDNVFTDFVLYDKNGEVVPKESYTINIVEKGKITITPIEITVISHTSSEKYDGTEKFSKYTVVEAERIVDDYEVIFTKATNVKRDLEGKVTYYENVITLSFHDAEKANNYEIKYVDENYEEGKIGEFTILPYEITVISLKTEKTYNGELQEGDCEVVDAENIPDTFFIEKTGKINVNRNGSGNVIPYENKVELTFTTKEIADNYNVTYENGQGVVGKFDDFTILPIDIIVTTKSYKKIYDTKEYVGEYTKDTSKVLASHSVVVVEKTKVTDVKRVDNIVVPYDNVVKIDVLDGGSSVMNNYNVTYKDEHGEDGYGQILIEPIAITIEALDAELKYNAKAQTAGYKILSGSFLDECKIITTEKTDVRRASTKVIYYNNEISVTFTNENKAVNYDITKTGSQGTYGILKITPVELTVKTGTADKNYDGTPLVYEKDFSVVGLVGSQEIKNTKFASAVYIGRYDNYVDFDVYDGSTVTTSNYDIVYGTLGRLTIKRVNYTLTITTAGWETGDQGTAADAIYSYTVTNSLDASKTYAQNIVKAEDGSILYVDVILSDGQNGNAYDVLRIYSTYSVDGNEISDNTVRYEIYSNDVKQNSLYNVLVKVGTIYPGWN